MAHRLSSRARGDLDDIWEQIVKGSSELAADSMILRSFPVGDYAIFYRIAAPVWSFSVCSTVAAI